MQCVAVCCNVFSVLQCVTVYGVGTTMSTSKSVSALTATDACTLQCVAVCFSVLQCVAVCLGVLQCVAVCCSVL